MYILPTPNREYPWNVIIWQRYSEISSYGVGLLHLVLKKRKQGQNELCISKHTSLGGGLV